MSESKDGSTTPAEKKPMNNKRPTDLIIALDYPRADLAYKLVDQLGGLPVIYKVGLELFMAAGPEFVRELVHRKCRVFLDLKFHDIPNTVARAAAQAALLHVEMFTVHLAGGRRMIDSVRDAFEKFPALKPKILGVSVLTSFDDVRWAEVTRAMTNHAMDVDDSVQGLVEAGTSWGVDGVVCSAMELEMLHEQFPLLYTIVPGIRPADYKPADPTREDQARIMTPAQARAAGAGAIVMGRPITEAADPKSVVLSVLKELEIPLSERTVSA